MDGSAGGRQALVIVGNGMMGFRLCRRLVECGASPGALDVVVFGEEPRPAYDRIRLTELLDGRGEDDLCFAPASWYRDHGIDLRVGDPVVRIDRAECVVESASGRVAPFDRLVLATGSRPFVPPIPGADVEGVFVYRTVEDLSRIRARALAGAHRAAVIGGGLLGLEAARAVQALGLEVHLIEASRGLLPRQLDAAGAALLREKVEALGVRVWTGTRSTRIEIAGAERAVCLDDGGRVRADLVVIAAGIRPRGELGRAAGLETGSAGGVVVDDHLQTSDPRIFAVGECATHRGVTYGLAAPGYRMIDVLVDNLVGGDAVFEGADRSARLKLLGVTVAALGHYEEAADTQAHTYLAGGAYRKLVLRAGRIVGAIAVGEWPDLERVRDAIDEPRRFSFWDLRRFRSTGNLWQKSESPPVYEWPADALVCGCLGVRRGALTEAEMEGCETAAELSARTGAGTACGSCRALLVELVQRARVDSMPPSRLSMLAEARGPVARRRAFPPPSAQPADPEISGVASPPTLRCSALSDPPTPPPHEPEPHQARSAIFLQAEGAPAAGRAEGRLLTLPSMSAVNLAPALPEGPPSSRRFDGAPPSSRRESLSPLRPVSVPASRVSGLVSVRLRASVLPAGPASERGARGLLVAAIAAIVASAALLLAPALPASRSFRGPHLDALWTERSLRQASGYMVVLLSLASLALPARKRWARFSRGTVAGLRVVHGALGAAALVGLVCHTGLHAGERLNRVLALDFLLASTLGAAAAATTAAGEAPGSLRRALVTRAHLYVLLPLPVLLALHVLGAYYF